MTPWLSLTRRQLFQSSGAVAAAGVATSSLSAVTARRADGDRRVLAADFSVAAKVPTPAHYMHDPGMAVLPSGRIFVAAPIRRRQEAQIAGAGPGPQSTSVLMVRSPDGGVTWQSLPSLPVYRDATPFVHDGKLYLLIPDYAEKRIVIMRSDDEGESWTAPATVFNAELWNCHTAMAVRDGRLYWALTNYPGGNSLVGASADLASDLLDAKSWRASAGCDLPAVPKELKRRLETPSTLPWNRPWDADTWLEPNVVNVNGRLRVLLRVVTGNFSTTNLGAVCELSDQDGGELRMHFVQFHPWPGAQCKCFILYDDRSRLFWMLSNIPTDSQDLLNRKTKLIDSGFIAGPGNERRILTLHYGVDALNWFPAGIAAMWPSPLQSFMYPSAGVYGNDLVFISRTSWNAPNQHDADVVTFHRIRDFRSLAVDLTAQG